MDKKYYEEYYHLERNHWFFTARLNILESQIKKHISRNPGKVLNILNIGVATGATSQMLDKYGTVTSLEYDKSSKCFYPGTSIRREFVRSHLLL